MKYPRIHLFRKNLELKLFYKIIPFLYLFIFISCEANDFPKPETLLIKVLPEYSLGERKNYSIKDVKAPILIINSKEDIRNSNLDKDFKDYIYHQNIDFSQVSLLVKLSVIDNVTKKRTLSYYRNKEGSYTFIIEYTIGEEEIPMNFEYICCLVKRIEKDTKIESFITLSH